MCLHYQAPNALQLAQNLGVNAPAQAKTDVWPGYTGAFIRLQAQTGAWQLECLPGLFGLVPHWAVDTQLARHTYNARAETVHTKPSFRDAVRKQQRCIIPVQAFFEPDWRTGNALPARIAARDHSVLGVAGLWSEWKSPRGEVLHSYAMLTVNADQHLLMNQFHKATDEKRMPVILDPYDYVDWLQGDEALEQFMRPYPAQQLVAQRHRGTQAMLL
ncbi:SOS response-associated peptidase [Curvibacter sp. CHRR-16]|uniref:SOS response-associated peptidase n=1 Tax=Curvibacter sp. CHRR-16 TaxID=2835872 RepID=UPI001BD9B72C|nr:SOS response-associated peptidase [Curvibacter sp. CHRR-16]MBT0569602.1 SOS response-associated peptidase [Curvibacter sp. CHRR-16]